MAEKPSIGADGEIERNPILYDEKPKRSDSRWRRLTYSPLLPVLVLAQTLLLLVICVGGGLLLTGVVKGEDLRCGLFAVCSAPHPLSTGALPTAVPALADLYVPSATLSSDVPCDSTSMDNAQIAFISDRTYPFGAVYEIDSSGNTCRFYQDSGGIYSITWSPDRHWMAYVSSDGLRMADGGGNHRDLLYAGDIRRDGIDWSPDGKQIAFAAHPVEKNNGSAEIIVVPLADKAVNVLTDSPGQDYSPAWSPDGKQITFVSDRDGGNRIYVMKANGSDQHRLTPDSVDELAAAWSPDGKYIAYSARPNANYQIEVRDLDNGSTQAITSDSSRAVAPRWSPNGRQIAYVGYANGNNEVYVIDIGGSNARKITSSRSDDYSPAWLR